MWCDDLNIKKVPSRIEIGELMETHGYVARKTNGEYMFSGITVTAQEQVPRSTDDEKGGEVDFC